MESSQNWTACCDFSLYTGCPSKIVSISCPSKIGSIFCPSKIGLTFRPSKTGSIFKLCRFFAQAEYCTPFRITVVTCTLCVIFRYWWGARCHYGEHLLHTCIIILYSMYYFIQCTAEAENQNRLNLKNDPIIAKYAIRMSNIDSRGSIVKYIFIFKRIFRPCKHTER